MKMKKIMIVPAALALLGLFAMGPRPASAQGIAGAGGRLRPKAVKRAAGALGLTKAQKVQLRQLQAKTRQKVETIRQDSTLTRKQKKAQLQGIRQTTKAQVGQILTAEQKAKLEKIRERIRERREERQSLNP